MLVRKNTWQIIIPVIILIFAVFLMAAVTEDTYALSSKSSTQPTVNLNQKSGEHIVKNNFDNASFAKDLNKVSDMLGLDVEEVGTLSKVRHVVSGALASIASFIFSIQVLFTFMASMLLNWSLKMDWINTLSDQIGKVMEHAFGDMFTFKGDSPVLFIVFFAMVGVVLSLARMRVSEGFGKFVKTILLVALCLFLVTSSSSVFKTINDIADEMSQGIVSSFTNKDNMRKNYELVWDINAIRPWKILQFGDLRFTSNELGATEGGGATDNATGKTWEQMNETERLQNQTANANPNMNDAEIKSFDWSSAKERPRWKGSSDYENGSATSKKKGKTTASTGVVNKDAAAGVLSKYKKKKNNGGKMYQMIGMKPSDRDDAASAIASADLGYFELSGGVQAKRVGMSVILLLLCIPLNLVTIGVAGVVIALKILALLMFFLWPIVVLWAMGTNNMSVITKWIVSIAMTFVGSILIQFVFSMLLSIVSQFHMDTYVSFGYWVMGSLLSTALFVAGIFLYPRIMHIIGENPNRGFMRGRSALARAFQAKQLHDIKEAISGNGSGGRSGEKNSNDEDIEETGHDKFGKPQVNPFTGENEEDPENEEENEEAEGDVGEGKDDVEAQEERGEEEPGEIEEDELQEGNDTNGVFGEQKPEEESNDGRESEQTAEVEQANAPLDTPKADAPSDESKPAPNGTAPNGKMDSGDVAEKARQVGNDGGAAEPAASAPIKQETDGKPAPETANADTPKESSTMSRDERKAASKDPYMNQAAKDVMGNSYGNRSATDDEVALIQERAGVLKKNAEKRQEVERKKDERETARRNAARAVRGAMGRTAPAKAGKAVAGKVGDVKSGVGNARDKIHGGFASRIENAANKYNANGTHTIRDGISKSVNAPANHAANPRPEPYSTAGKTVAKKTKGTWNTLTGDIKGRPKD